MLRTALERWRAGLRKLWPRGTAGADGVATDHDDWRWLETHLGEAMPRDVAVETAATAPSDHMTAWLRRTGPDTIEKAIARRGGRRGQIWLKEPRFYAELAAKVGAADFVVPALVDIEPRDRALVVLSLRFHEAAPVRDLPGRHALAAAFGRLAARCAGHAVHGLDWLPQADGLSARPGLPDPDPLLALGREIDAAAPMDRIVEGLSTHRAGLHALYAAAPRTLCHGDANHLNALRLAAEPDRFLVIDWAGVCGGAMGEDLVRLVYPWLVTSGTCGGRADLATCEADLLDTYLGALAAGRDGLDLEAVRTAFEVRSVVMAVIMARTYRTWPAKLRDAAQRDRAAALLGDFYGMIADRVEALGRRAG